jgi:S1-C subfamily serine protease
MDRIFFGKPFKTVIIGLLLSVLGLCGIGSYSADAQNWEDTRLLMDLQNGGAELFRETSPSIIEVMQMEILSYRGATGSGYVIDKEGHAITNRHVVGESEVFEIAFFGDENTGKRYKAKLIGKDPQLDLAVIKIEADPEILHPIKIADTEKVKVGDVVATLGSPGGDAGTVDPGDQSIANENWMDFFNLNIGVLDEILDFHHAIMFYSNYPTVANQGPDQYYGSGVQYLFHVSAAINHGNSGGPAINALGEAIGTNTWGIFALENVGYSVPANLLKRGVKDIISYGRVRTPWLGIICHKAKVDPQWDAIQNQTGVTNEWNLWFDVEVDIPEVVDINTYSPAYKAGIRKGDKILSVNGKRYHNVFDLYKFILNNQIGNKVTLYIERNGNGIPPITVELAEKKIRYDQIIIDSYSVRDYSSPYVAQLTY